MRGTPPLLAAIVLMAAPFATAAQDCPEVATVGNFEVRFEGAAYNGDDTTFDYCITGLDVPGFRALSNWELALDQTCVLAEDLTGCGPEPCYYQKEDPNTGITGIKFDEVVVDAGQTVCYFFSLDGDWTSRIGVTEIGLKAGGEVSTGEICGPVCEDCRAAMRVRVEAGQAPWLRVYLEHRRPPTVVTKIYYRVLDAAGNLLGRWVDGPVTFDYGTIYRYDGPMPGVGPLAPGTYGVEMRLKGMSGWMAKSVTFVVPAGS